MDAYLHSFIVNYPSPFRMVSFKAYIALQLFYKSPSSPTLPLFSPVRTSCPWKVLSCPAGEKTEWMCCTIHSFPYHNIISAFRCPELERTRALWWCLLWFFPSLSLFSFYIRDTGQTGAADVPVCSPMQNDLLLQAPPPFLASISSDCQALQVIVGV